MRCETAESNKTSSIHPSASSAAARPASHVTASDHATSQLLQYLAVSAALIDPDMDCQPLKLPDITLPTAGPSGSPRIRSASLSVARSPVVSPFSAVVTEHDPFDDATSPGAGGARRGSLGTPKAHRKGQSVQMQPLRASMADLTSLGADSARKRQTRASLDSLADELEDDRRGAAGPEADDEDYLLDEEMRMLGGDIPQRPKRYEGPFQKPDSKELMAILLSFTAVALLAVAAGLTTIYDWVL